MDTSNRRSNAHTLGEILKLLVPASRIDEEGNKNIVVLSKHFILTEAQYKLLNKGLTFVPTPKLDSDTKSQMKLDLQNYHRKLKLATFFENKNQSDPTPFVLKSGWTPSNNQIPKTILNLMRADKYGLKSLQWNVGEPPNITATERQALKQLQGNKKIIMKPADKGNAIVIMDRDQYIWEAQRQLDNTEYYKKLTTPIYLETAQLVSEILDKLKKKGYIDYKQRLYLKGNDLPRPRRFYLLPKIHKDPQNWSIPHKIPPGRPIVSDCGSETYKTAEYIEYFLNPISTRHPSYIKDTYDFIGKIKNLKIPEQSYLFSIDVDSLYTNIDTESGLKAIKKYFQKYPNPNRPDNELLELLYINLVKNDFEFNSEFYLQVKGTAMGKKFAPSYANIFMADWEESALDLCPLKPKQYFRFLDDIWGIWTHSKEDFLTFIHLLNSHHKSIKIKYTLEDTFVNFLDTVTYKGTQFTQNSQLDIKVYFKDTDTHALLHKESFHPKHTHKGILKSQLLRFHKICTQKADFFEATRTLFSALRKRGYSRSFLRRGLKTFLEKKITKDTEMIPLITTYSSQSIKMNRKAKENFERFIRPANILKKCNIISAYRRNKNLKDYLIYSKVPPLVNNKKKKIISKCPEFEPRLWLTNQKNKEIIKIYPILPTHAKNCIYLISCKKCRIRYVGETQNAIATRINQHRYNIRHHKETNTLVVQHFLSHGLSSLRVMGLESNPSWTLFKRKKAEQRWITKLGTMTPDGLNEK